MFLFCLDMNFQEFKRLPFTGKLNIKDLREFLKESKIIFEQRWNLLIKYTDSLIDFTPLKHLGNGTFGSVYLVEYHKNNDHYAMKVIVKDRVAKSKQIEHLKSEKKVLECTNFPFLVYLNSCFQDNRNVYLVTPYIAYELFDLMCHLERLSEGQAMFYASQVVLAIEYLHYLNLVYRDLKPENVLLDETGYVKLTDFGFCKRLENDRTFTMCGTPDYIAPEVLLLKGYNQSADWWSCGVFVFELVAGYAPFHAKTPKLTYTNVLLGKFKFPPSFSTELKDLIEKILTADLSKRYGNLKNGASEIKCHRWFRPVNWMAILNRTATVPFPPPLPARTRGLDFEEVKSQLGEGPLADAIYLDQFIDF